jgi:predicted trehalose synthase
VSLRERELHQAKVLEERENLRNRTKLCAYLEAFLWQVMPTNTETIVTQARRNWETLPPLPSALAEATQHRFETICEALSAGEENRQILRQTLEENTEKKQQLCIRMEVAAGIESPPEFAQARMAYQVARLSESLHNRNAAKATVNRLEEAFNIEQEWHLLGASPPAQEEGLEKRFQQALAAFLGTK